MKRLGLATLALLSTSATAKKYENVSRAAKAEKFLTSAPEQRNINIDPAFYERNMSMDIEGFNQQLDFLKVDSSASISISIDQINHDLVIEFDEGSAYDGKQCAQILADLYALG